MNKTQMANSKGLLYYVGDIGYAMTPDEWNDALELYWADPYLPFYEFSDGRQFTLSETPYGDSGAVDQEGFGYATDSGLLGIMRANNIDREQMPTVQTMLEQKGVRFVRIPAETVAAVIENGLSPFGEVIYSDEDFVIIDDII
jgi:hypothetical protein